MCKICSILALLNVNKPFVPHFSPLNSAPFFRSFCKLLEYELPTFSLQGQENVGNFVIGITKRLWLYRAINQREQRESLLSLCRAEAVNGDVSRNLVAITLGTDLYLSVHQERQQLVAQLRQREYLFLVPNNQRKQYIKCLP